MKVACPEYVRAASETDQRHSSCKVQWFPVRQIVHGLPVRPLSLPDALPDSQQVCSQVVRMHCAMAIRRYRCL